MNFGEKDKHSVEPGKLTKLALKYNMELALYL